MKCRLSFLFCIAATLAPACKNNEQDGSGANSLENLAAGRKIRDNVCQAADAPAKAKQGPLTDSIIFDVGVAGDRSTLTEELLTTLTAVPTDVQSLFKKLGGKVFLTSDVNSHCFAKAKKDNPLAYQAHNATALDACYVYDENSAGGAGRTLRVVIKADVKAIRHATNLAFGYLFAQFFSKIEVSSDLSAIKVGTPSDSMKDLKLNLLQAFAKDLATSKVFDLESFDADFFGPGAAATIKANLAANKPIFTGVPFKRTGETTDPDDRTRTFRMLSLGEIIFAESFDSRYCNDWASYSDAAAKTFLAEKRSRDDLAEFFEKTQNTAKPFRDFFPGTHGQFKAAEGAINAYTKNMLAGGLGLATGWHKSFSP